jgi:hypothetical protein
MGKSSKTADVKGAAEAEGEFSREAARDQTYADRPDQYNAMGSNTWQQESVRDPATGEMTTKWSQRQNLAPDVQKVYDADLQRNTRTAQMAAGMGDRVANDMGAPLDWDQFGGVMAGPQSAGRVGGDLSATTGTDRFEWDSTANRQRAEDDAYGRSTQRLDPQFQQDRATLERQMAGRGLRQGDSAYDSAMQNYDTGKNDAYEMARMGATAEGRLEDDQAFGQADTSWNTNLATEQQRFGQLEGVASNSRAADKQAFDQKMLANERANALRTQQIDEYVGKRGHSLKEQNDLAASNNIGDMAQTYGGG